MLREEAHAAEIRSLSRDAAQSSGAAGGAEPGGGGAGATGARGHNAAMMRSSIDESLEEARKKGKLSQKEAMELMVKMMALQRLDKGAGAGAAKGPGACRGGGAQGSAGDEVTAAGCTANVVPNPYTLHPKP
jgi:hypothetical protein